MCGTRQQLTDAACQSIIPRVCVSNQTQLFLSLSKRVPRPPCLEPDNISLMRPVTAELLLFVSGTRHNFFYPYQSLYLDHHVWNQITFH